MVEKAKKQGSFVSPPVSTISESSGIPKGKYFPQRHESELRPLFTGQVFFEYFLRPRGCPGETQVALRGVWAGMSVGLTTKDGALRMRRPSSLTDESDAVTGRGAGSRRCRDTFPIG